MMSNIGPVLVKNYKNQTSNLLLISKSGNNNKIFKLFCHHAVKCNNETMQQPFEVDITQHLGKKSKSSIRTLFILSSIPLDSLMSRFLDLIGFEKKFPLSVNGLNDIRVFEKPITVKDMR